MDLGQIIVLLLLVLFPLLDYLSSRGKRGEQPGPPPEQPRPGTQPPLPSRVPGEAPMRLEPVGGWGDWSVGPPEGADDEELAGEEVMDEEEAARLAARQERMTPERDAEAVRVTVPVVSLEPLHVDRSAPRARIRSIGEPPTRSANAAPPRLASALQGREGLRRAVLLAEVLAPPKGLRDLDGRNGSEV